LKVMVLCSPLVLTKSNEMVNVFPEIFLSWFWNYTVPIDVRMSSLGVKTENGKAGPRLNFLRKIVSKVPSDL
jgi:hypothetical protein